MKTYFKVRARYVNTLGYPVEITKKVTEAQLNEMLNMENVTVITVDGTPGNEFYRKLAK